DPGEGLFAVHFLQPEVGVVLGLGEHGEGGQREGEDGDQSLHGLIISLAGSLSSSNVRCRTRTASSMYFSSTTTEVLISDVEIIWILTPSRARAPNILEAMPAWVRMPMPTRETLAMRSSPWMPFAPMA